MGRQSTEGWLAAGALCYIQSLFLQFVSLSLDQLSNEEWLLELGGAMNDKEYVTTTFNNYSDEKVSVCQCCVLIMCIICV